MIAGGTIVLALMLVSLRNRDLVAVEIKAEGGRTRSLSLAGIVGYSMAVVLALTWVASIWVWQMFEHEISKWRTIPEPRASGPP